MVKSASEGGIGFFGHAVALAALLCSTSTLASQSDVRLAWTLEDIVTAPEVTDIGLSVDKDYGLFVVKAADVQRNENRFELRRVNVSDGSQTVLLNASFIKRLHKIPSSKDWSALIDRGEGQQLYRIDQSGKIEPLIISEQTVLVGSTDQAISSMDGEKPLEVGISSYDWSPDGQTLWYAKLRKSSDKEPVIFDEAVTAQRDRRRTPVPAFVDFYVRDENGKDRLVTSRPVSDYFAFRFGGRVKWDGTKVKYRTATPDGRDRYTFQSYAYSLDDHSVRPDNEQTKDHATFAVWGPNGGTMASEGIGSSRRIFETFEDGSRKDYGAVRFSIGDPRSAGSFLSADGKRAIIGMRDLDTHHYGLALADRASVRSISVRGSFTKCDFDPGLTYGLCIRQGLTIAPQIVTIQPRSGAINRIAAVSQRHDSLPPLDASPRIWTNRLGYQATGFVVRPTDYNVSKSYPAIFVTHGNDADERFVAADIQWNYPVQLLAQAGYVVVLIDDPSPLQEPRIAAAINQLVNGRGDIPPSEIQQLFWLNNVYSIEDAAREMAREGLVDLQRVGIAGYSRGSQIVNVAMTQSKLFKAGSSGDGSHLEPHMYTVARTTFDMIFGGPPFGDNFKNYQALSPSIRASRSCGAILSQMALPYPGAIDFHLGLRAAGVPAQISLYPGETPQSDETHLFHIPLNRLAAMKENLAWFDYWLLGRKTDGVAPERIAHWAEMAQKWPKDCPVQTPLNPEPPEATFRPSQ